MEKKKSRRWLIIAVAILVIAAAVAIILLITKKKDSYRVIKIYEVEGAAFVQRDGVDDLKHASEIRRHRACGCREHDTQAG